MAQTDVVTAFPPDADVVVLNYGNFLLFPPDADGLIYYGFPPDADELGTTGSRPTRT